MQHEPTPGSAIHRGGQQAAIALAIVVGGAVWAWLYESSQSVVGPWLSHVLVDAAIFLIGFDLVRATSAS